MKVFAIIAVLLGALFTGLNNFARRESGVLHQLVECERYCLELTGRLDTHMESPAFWKRIYSQDTPIDSSPVPVLRRILAFCPRVRSFLKSRQDLQRCEIVARHLEKELEKVHSNLGFFQCLKTLMTEKVGHICVFSAVCLTLGAISLLMRFVCSKKQDIDLEDEQQENDDFELEWSSLDSSLDETEEFEELQLMEEKALLERQKEELEAENGRLCRRIDAIQKEKEAELENSNKTIHDLKLINDHNKAEIASLSQKIRAAQEERKAVVERSAKNIRNLQQSNKELEAEYDLVFSGYEALQSQRAEENENAKKIIDDLQERNDQLLKEIADKEASAQQHLKKAEDLEESVRLLKEELERAKEGNRAHIEIQSGLLKEKEELKKSTEETHKAGKECLNTQKAEKCQRKLITFDLPPDQPQTKSSIFSGLGSPKESPKSRQATSGQKEEEKIVVTVKKRVKDGKRDVSFEKKEPHKPEEGCQQPQKERKVERKRIVFDLEPDQPEVIRSISGLSRPLPRHQPPRYDQEENWIIFRGEKLQLKRLEEMEGEMTVELDVPRNFHRAINGIQGRTLEEITNKSGVALIQMPGRFEVSDLITIVGTAEQVRLAAGHIERLISKLH
ncbi:trichohyalin-like [Macrobrachium nipponense]|uniref:trichohyalin-like n=1 Tax=Macrobrachium nipponense TaxID=159736 RepID=UPI0030C88901